MTMAVSVLLVGINLNVICTSKLIQHQKKGVQTMETTLTKFSDQIMFNGKQLQTLISTIWSLSEISATETPSTKIRSMVYAECRNVPVTMMKDVTSPLAIKVQRL